MAHFSSVDINDRTNAKGTALRVTQFFFTETTGAGTYTASALLPADAVIHDIIVHAQALWDTATSATLKIGDAADDDGFFTGVNLKATDLLAGESISFAFPGGKQGADVDADAAGAQHVRRRSLTTTRTVSAIVSAVGATGSAGRTRIDLVWSAPPAKGVDVVAATKA